MALLLIIIVVVVAICNVKAIIIYVVVVVVVAIAVYTANLTICCFIFCCKDRFLVYAFGCFYRFLLDNSLI